MAADEKHNNKSGYSNFALCLDYSFRDTAFLKFVPWNVPEFTHNDITDELAAGRWIVGALLNRFNAAIPESDYPSQLREWD